MISFFYKSIYCTAMFSSILKTETKLRLSKFSSDLSSNILLIRHGESIFNCEYLKLKDIKDPKQHEEQRNYVKFTERLFDSDLTALGSKQAKVAGDTLTSMNIKYVFVSPVLRALKTCSKMLKQIEANNKDNSNYQRPNVIVHPFLYEKIEDNCDFFSTDFTIKKSLFSSYDWSLVDEISTTPYYYFRFCDNYVNESGELCKTNVDTEAIKINSNDNYYIHLFNKHYEEFNNRNIGGLFLQEIKKLDKFSTWIESSESTFERNKIFNKTLLEYSLKLKENEKILAVGHSIFFKHLTLIDYNLDAFNTENFSYLKNCEIVSYYL